jgi:hypothetical protein
MQGLGNQWQKWEVRRVSHTLPPSHVIVKGSEYFSRKFSSVHVFWKWKALTPVKGNGFRNSVQRNVFVIKVNSKGSLCRTNCLLLDGSKQQTQAELPGLNSRCRFSTLCPSTRSPRLFLVPPIELPLFPRGTVSGTCVSRICVLRD